MKSSCLSACLILAAWPFAARAEHARIDLQVIHIDPVTEADGDSVSATADTEPPAGGFNQRPVAKIAVGEPLALQFVLTNKYPHGVLKDVTVRYYIVREEKLGQKNLPDMTKGTVTEGKFTMNFKPACRVGARIRFKVKEPGLYLLRVETQNTDSDHEHFSAIDVQAEAAPRCGAHQSMVFPTPSAWARAKTRAAVATSSSAMPSDLKSVTSCGCLRPG